MFKVNTLVPLTGIYKKIADIMFVDRIEHIYMSSKAIDNFLMLNDLKSIPYDKIKEHSKHIQMDNYVVDGLKLVIRGSSEKLPNITLNIVLVPSIVHETILLYNRNVKDLYVYFMYLLTELKFNAYKEGYDTNITKVNIECYLTLEYIIDIKI